MGLYTVSPKQHQALETILKHPRQYTALIKGIFQNGGVQMLNRKYRLIKTANGRYDAVQINSQNPFNDDEAQGLSRSDYGNDRTSTNDNAFGLSNSTISHHHHDQLAGQQGISSSNPGKRDSKRNLNHQLPQTGEPNHSTGLIGTIFAGAGALIAEIGHAIDFKKRS